MTEKVTDRSRSRSSPPSVTRQNSRRGLLGCFSCYGSSSRHRDKSKDDFAQVASSDTSTLLVNESPTTASSKAVFSSSQRTKDGLCPTCGQQTHLVVDYSINSPAAARLARLQGKNPIKKTPINLIPNKVVCGTCVKCNIVPGYEFLYSPPVARNNGPTGPSTAPPRSFDSSENVEVGTVVSEITTDIAIMPDEDLNHTNPHFRPREETEHHFGINPTRPNHRGHDGEAPPPAYHSVFPINGINAVVQGPTAQLAQRAQRPMVMYNNTVYRHSLATNDREIQQRRYNQETEARTERLAYR